MTRTALLFFGCATAVLVAACSPDDPGPVDGSAASGGGGGTHNGSDANTGGAGQTAGAAGAVAGMGGAAGAAKADSGLDAPSDAPPARDVDDGGDASPDSSLDAPRPIDAARDDDASVLPDGAIGDATPSADANDVEAGRGNDVDSGAFRPLACGSCGPAGKFVVQVPSMSRAHQPPLGGGCSPGVDPDWGCREEAIEPCSLPRALAVCGTSGRCAVGACRSGYADCDHDPSNGCEVDLRTTSDCTACGNQCGGGEVCTPSGCAASCDPPNTLCSASRCADTTNDTSACGDCVTICSGPTYRENFTAYTCTGGTCGTPCATVGDAGAYAETPLGCVDLQSDIGNCGSIGNACAAPLGGVAYCAQGVCGSSCPPAQVLCGGRCVASAVDPLNCGSCGVTCAPDEACAAGHCTLMSSLWLVTGLIEPTDIKVDETSVYWTDQKKGTVERIPKNGGVAQPLATGQNTPDYLDIDADYVYWTDGVRGTVMRVGKTGGTPELIATASGPSRIAVVGDNVYYKEGNYPRDGITRAPKAGGGVPVRMLYDSGEWATRVLKDDRFVYAAADGIVTTIDTQNGDAMEHISQVTPFAVNRDYFFSKVGMTTVALQWHDRMTRERRRHLVLRSSQGPGPNFPAHSVYTVDDCALYAVGSTIEMYPLGALYPVTVLRGISGKRLVSDGTSLFWLDQTAIGKIPIP